MQKSTKKGQVFPRIRWDDKMLVVVVFVIVIVTVIVVVVVAPKFGMTGQEVARSSSSLNGCGGAIYGRRRRRKKAYADGKGSLEARIFHEDDSGSRGTMQ